MDRNTQHKTQHESAPGLMLRDAVPVILAGGTGRRLWPLSTRRLPKPFLKLPFSPTTMLQQTALRTAGVMKPPLVVCNVRHRGLALEQLGAAGVRPARLLLEPQGRDTAPAIAAAAHYLAGSGMAETPMLVMPSDHDIRDPGLLLRAAEAGLPRARAGMVVTFGIVPDRAETAYGYIRAGADLGGGVFAARAFREKPDRKTAASLLREGGWFWNSGLFLLTAGTAAAAFERHAPELWDAVGAAVRGASCLRESIVLDEARFAAAPALSFDRAVMEKADNAALVPAAPGWRDLGSWRAVAASLFRRQDLSCRG